MKYYAILVAGGSGSRMNNTVAKQFLLLGGKPVLMHTIEAFHQCVLNPEILVVLNKQQHAYWKSLCNTYDFKIQHQIIEGGTQRYYSVKNGLNAIKEDGIVAVHDAVRPLVPTELILRSFENATQKGNAVAGIYPVDSVRSIQNSLEENSALNRDQVMLIQTPQTFTVEILKNAYQQPYSDNFTDDASVVEQAGFNINLITGSRENLKITWPEDIEIAEVLLKKRGS